MMRDYFNNCAINCEGIFSMDSEEIQRILHKDSYVYGLFDHVTNSSNNTTWSVELSEE
jgi:hypothetical protein